MPMQSNKILVAGALAAVALSPAVALGDWVPNRPVEFVVAAGPGGGTDIFARVVQSAMTKNNLLPVPVIVSNKSGGSGAETFIYAKTSPGDPYKLYFGTQDAYVLPLASRLNYTMNDLTPIASMVLDPFILWTNPKFSGIEDVKSFIAQAKEKPGALKVGGAKAREADETATSEVEHAAGVKLTYIPYKSGSETAVQLAGGHIHANVNNPSESIEQWKAGLQKPLCVMEQQRLADKTIIAGGKSWNDVPTCMEAGLAIKRFTQPRTVWMAAKVPPEAVAYYTEIVRKAAATPEFKAYMEQGSQIPALMTGQEFKDFIKQHRTSFVEIYKRNDWLKGEQN
jgi:tripartite-type tricarboxylate transporter receptor subunit TctC